MAINANYFPFRGYTFKPDSIAFSDRETQDVNINRNGTITTVQLVKKTVTFTLVGGTEADLVAFENERDNNVSGLITGAASFEDINVFGYLIPDAILTKVNPSKPFTANGINFMDTIELVFDSQTFK
jgi:hypothetical protein